MKWKITREMFLWEGVEEAFGYMERDRKVEVEGGEKAEEEWDDVRMIDHSDTDWDPGSFFWCFGSSCW